MLSFLFELMPLFIVRWVATSRCERLHDHGRVFISARPDTFFIPKRYQRSRKKQP
jgi:hypothetical protein